MVGCGSLHRTAAAKGLVEALQGLLPVHSDLQSNGSCLGALGVVAINANYAYDACRNKTINGSTTST